MSLQVRDRKNNQQQNQTPRNLRHYNFQVQNIKYKIIMICLYISYISIKQEQEIIKNELANFFKEPKRCFRNK